MFVLSRGESEWRWIAQGHSQEPASHRVCSQILELVGNQFLEADALEHRVVFDDGHPAHVFWHVLDQLCRWRVLETSVISRSRRLLTVRGVLPLLLPEAVRKTALSRFAILRSVDGRLMVETPFTAGTIEICSDEAILYFARLMSGVSAAGSGEPGPVDVASDEMHAMARAFDAVGALDNRDDDTLVQWEPEDALFHARTRGLMNGRRGGTYRFLGKRPPAPAHAKRVLGPVVPAIHQAPTSGHTSLESLLDRRRSIRRYDEVALTAPELFTFLRCVARVRSFGPIDSHRGVHYETVQRASASGGACHELELYPVIHRCTGLKGGMYWYNSFSDELQQISGPTDASQRLLVRSAQSMGISPNMPDVLLCIAARFARVNWKYEGMAYATILKNVGALMSTMYLVATSMGLAPCAIGGGDSADFTAATGHSAFEEDGVGEFALGRPAR